MLAAASDCAAAWHTTNGALKTRISEIIGAKTKMEEHIRKLDQDIITLRRHIEDVQKALAAKIPALQV
jgi:prefoldin subunit 5